MVNHTQVSPCPCHVSHKSFPQHHVQNDLSPSNFVTKHDPAASHPAPENSCKNGTSSLHFLTQPSILQLVHSWALVGRDLTPTITNVKKYDSLVNVNIPRVHCKWSSCVPRTNKLVFSCFSDFGVVWIKTKKAVCVCLYVCNMQNHLEQGTKMMPTFSKPLRQKKRKLC